jgi:hypothetical protein
MMARGVARGHAALGRVVKAELIDGIFLDDASGLDSELAPGRDARSGGSSATRATRCRWRSSRRPSRTSWVRREVATPHWTRRRTWWTGSCPTAAPSSPGMPGTGKLGPDAGELGEAAPAPLRHGR